MATDSSKSKNPGIMVFAIWFILMMSLSTAYADTCADCHTSLEKLKKLAPALPEQPKKLSEGEG